MKHQRRIPRRSLSRDRTSANFGVEDFLQNLTPKALVLEYPKKTNIFVQGEPAGGCHHS